jgi:aspartyl-tRNA(Asn)/glutamyl-tRNA(Gln) amidotransferase subunit C
MIDSDVMKKLSKLSKIKLPENEVDGFIFKLQNVINMIDTLKEVDTEGIAPLTSAVRANLYLREDKVSDGNIADDLFKNVPGNSASMAKEIKCFVVPKVVE